MGLSKYEALWEFPEYLVQEIYYANLQMTTGTRVNWQGTSVMDRAVEILKERYATQQ